MRRWTFFFILLALTFLSKTAVSQPATCPTLVSEAHKRGIKVLVDYAMNHVHKDSPVYTMHKDWFNPLDKGGGQCVCGSATCPWDGPTATVQKPTWRIQSGGRAPAPQRERELA